MIPIFEKFIYPAAKRLRIPQRPLQRMGAGWGSLVFDEAKVEMLLFRDGVLCCGIRDLCDSTAAHRQCLCYSTGCQFELCACMWLWLMFEVVVDG